MIYLCFALQEGIVDVLKWKKIKIMLILADMRKNNKFFF